MSILAMITKKIPDMTDKQKIEKILRKSERQQRFLIEVKNYEIFCREQDPLTVARSLAGLRSQVATAEAVLQEILLIKAQMQEFVK